MDLPPFPVAEPEEVWAEVAPIPGLPCPPRPHDAWWWAGVAGWCALAIVLPLLMLAGHFAA